MMIINLKSFILLILISILILSCEPESHVRTYRLSKKVEKSQDNLEKGAKEDFKLGWEKPAIWDKVDGHSMRLASFSAPFKNGNADISITSFSGESGGVVSNVNRWLNQIDLDNMSENSINEIAEKKSGNLGDFLYFKLVNESNAQSAILAAIYQLENRTVFVKLSSTLIGSEEIESDFISFCKSIYIVQ